MINIERTLCPLSCFSFMHLDCLLCFVISLISVWLFYGCVLFLYICIWSLSGVSWFIPAENLRSEARKENQPEESSTWRPSTAWFEPYSGRHPWREPLRQRQVHEDRNQQPGFIHDAEIDEEPRTKTVSSGLAHVSLQVSIWVFLYKYNFTGQMFIFRFKKCNDV